MKRLKFFLLIVLTACLSIALCACSGDTNNNAGNQTEESLTATPKDGGSVIVGIQNDLDSLDPHKANAAGTKEVLFNMYEGLVKPDQNGNMVPAVASDVIFSEDGLTIYFPLRENVKFSNGELVTADDVIYSIKRCAGLLETSDAEVSVDKALSSITDVSEYKTDDNKPGIKITLKEQNPDIVGYLTCAIIPADYKDADKTPIGVGPFRFVSYTPLTNIVMEKNPYYYVEGVPYLDQVTFKISSNTDAAFMELLAGTIDIYPYMTAEQANQLTENYRIETGAMNLVQGLFLNNAAAPFDNKLVRQAVYYAIDRQLVIDMVGDGLGTIVGTPVYTQFAKYYDASLADAYAYNVEKAKELLAQAGYPDGFTFTITVPGNYQFHVDTAQVLVECLKNVGITAKIQTVEWTSWLTDVYTNREYEATVIGLDSNLTPSNVMYRYVSDDAKNFINFSSKEYDEVYAKAKIETEDTKKKEYYQRLQEILSEEAASVFIQDPANITAVKKNIYGYQFYPVYVQDMSTVYLSE